MRLIIISFLFILLLVFSNSNAQTWNMWNDFSYDTNPNGSWSYGRKWTPESTSFDLLTELWQPGWWWLGNFGHGAPAIMDFGQSGLCFWARNNAYGLPAIRWTCPVSGIYKLFSKFNPH